MYLISRRKSDFLRVFILFMIVSYASAGLYADGYSLDPVLDTVTLSTSAGLFLLGKIVQNNKPAITAGEIAGLNRNDIFYIDRQFMADFSPAPDLASDITEYTSLAMPLLPALGAAVNLNYKELFSITVEYAESLMYSLGVKNLLKGMIKRFRPYAYYAGGNNGYFSPEYLAAENSETAMSFPSGHTTAAFTGAVFAGMIFDRYFPDSPLRIPVWITALTAASATGILRVLSGNHYVTDVVSGAVIGSFFGFIVPYMHDPGF